MRNRLAIPRLVPLIAALFSSPLLAWNAQAADLLQIYSQALANDAVYASARSAQVAGQEKAVQGRASLLPGIGLGGSYTRNSSDASGSADYSANSYRLSLTQPLFNLGNWESYQQSKLAVVLADTQFAQAQQDLIVRVSQAYFDVLTAQDTLLFLQQQQAFISEQLASAKRNFEVGTATITDTNEAQARFDLSVAQQIAAQSDLEVKRAALQQIVGDAPAELAPLRPGVKLSAPEPAQLNLWVTSAENQNYEVLRQQLALEIAKREIKRNRAGHYPTVDLIASRSHSNSNQSSAAEPERRHREFEFDWRAMVDPAVFRLCGRQQGARSDRAGRQGAQRPAVYATDFGAGGTAGIRRRQQRSGASARAGSGRSVQPVGAGIEQARLPGRRAHQHRCAERRAATVFHPARPGEGALRHGDERLAPESGSRLIAGRGPGAGQPVAGAGCLLSIRRTAPRVIGPRYALRGTGVRLIEPDRPAYLTLP